MNQTKNDDHFSISLSLIFFCLVINIGVIFYNQVSEKQKRMDEELFREKFQTASPILLSPLRADDHVRGNKNASVVLFVFSDTECPYCKTLHKNIQEKLSEEIQQGQVLFVYRHFPLSIHSHALLEAEATECAQELSGEEGFWSYLDSLFRVTPSNDDLDPALLPKIASDLSLSKKDFEACLESRKYTEKVRRDILDGTRAGVSKTPTSIIWDTQTDVKKIVIGNNIHEIQSIIAEFLRKSI